MKKRMLIMGIALLIIFGGIIAFNLIKSILIKRFFAHYQPPSVSVASAIAKSVNWHPTINAVGNFVALKGVEVNSQASGTISQINFESGQYIEEGAPLISIDDSVEQAVLKFNQAELTLKNLNYQRQNDLFKRGATPISNVDEAKANRDQAQAKLEQTLAQINQKHIKAPFSGKLGIRQVNVGQFVTPGQTSIVSLQSLDPLYLEFYLPEQLYKRIHPNQNILFSVEAFPNLLFKAKVTAINSKVDVTTHNMLVQGTLSNCPSSAVINPKQSPLVHTQKESMGSQLIVSCDTNENIKNKIHNFTFVPGMFASIEISQPAESKTIMVPSTAISYSLYGNSIYIIEKDKEASNGLAVKRVFVTTGQQQGNYTVIKKGIKAGQLIVSAGEIKLQNGTPVVINNEIKLHDVSQQEMLPQ